MPPLLLRNNRPRINAIPKLLVYIISSRPKSQKSAYGSRTKKILGASILRLEHMRSLSRIGLNKASRGQNGATYPTGPGSTKTTRRFEPGRNVYFLKLLASLK